MADIASGTGTRTSFDNSLPSRPQQLLDCDLVMKGGITSGLVYPKAVVRFARDYQVRNVGGTSVGAIAAALTAAAEYQRQAQPDPADAWSDELDAALSRDLATDDDDVTATALSTTTGFAGLYTIPNDIGDDLPGKFQPEPKTASLFHYLMRLMTYESKPGKAIAAIFLGLWVQRIVAVILGVLVFGSIRLLDPTAEGRVSLVIGAVVVIAAIVIARTIAPTRRVPIWAVFALGTLGALIVARFAWIWLTGDSIGDLARVGDTIAMDDTAGDELSAWQSVIVDLVPFMVLFWMAGAVAWVVWCFRTILPKTFYGMCTGLGDDNALTNWLHRRLNGVAGLPAGEVLTFGHLERDGIAEPEATRSKKQVHLVVIATDIRRGVPLDLPRALPGSYLFKRDELERFFPMEVIEALVDGSTPDARERYEFPAVEKIPVLVAARMSMSFPILFCAVPVYYRDSGGEIRKTWLSDGGIVSNFPSNKFDRALPPWPTFGLDLVDVGKELEPGSPVEDQNMRRWLIPNWPYRMSSEDSNPERLPTKKLDSVAGFLMSAVNAARGWMDNSQKRLPGFAERIVAIKIYKGEGGLNLTMDAKSVQSLARRGLVGADQLIHQWLPDAPESQWRYHRWVRLRTLMRELEEIGREWKAWYEADANPLPFAARTADAALETFEEMAEYMPVDTTIGDPKAGDAPANPENPHPYPYPWRYAVDLARADVLVDRFNAFAQHTDYGLEPKESVKEASENMGRNAIAVVFDAPDSPSPNPKFLLMPPYE